MLLSGVFLIRQLIAVISEGMGRTREYVTRTSTFSVSRVSRLVPWTMMGLVLENSLSALQSG